MLAPPNVKLSMELHHSMHTSLLVILEKINTGIIVILYPMIMFGSHYIMELHDLFDRLLFLSLWMFICLSNLIT
jgi:hypothetical protein